MTVEEFLAKLRFMPKRAEAVALEPGCQEYCEREIDDVEATAHRVYLHLGSFSPGRHEIDGSGLWWGGLE